jgi:hypothetical protein
MGYIENMSWLPLFDIVGWKDNFGYLFIDTTRGTAYGRIG